MMVTRAHSGPLTSAWIHGAAFGVDFTAGGTGTVGTTNGTLAVSCCAGIASVSDVAVDRLRRT